MTPDVVHIIVGPSQHGVVSHAELIANALGQHVVRVGSVDELDHLPPCAVAHVAWTDRLFGPDLASAERAFDRVAALVRASGAALSVTLHDVPHDPSELQQRRAAVYRRVMAAARGVVVNSAVELSLVQQDADGVHSLRLIRLPVPTPVAVTPESNLRPLPGRSVVVLGFVYPDRGYDDVLAALPDGATLVAVGRPSDGHDDLARRYADLGGPRWSMTGYVPEEELAGYLHTAAVPIAPNRRVTASGSINTWLSHGRRPLVPDSPYGRELATDRPGAIQLYDPDDPTALADSISAALADPGSTWLPDGGGRGPDVIETAQAYRQHFAACAPAAPIRSGDTWVVPANRWDLLDTTTVSPVPVSVVIPYYEAQHLLDLVLTGLTQQRYPHDQMQIVVVDDGSRKAPDVHASGEVETVVIRQENAGFRAARARNVGAQAAEGMVLVFLDGDTVPEPDFLTALTALPSLCADAVTVGRRRHADLGDTSVEQVRRWSTGRSDLQCLDEPAWLADAYRRSSNLLQSDRRSYRFLISALLALHRDVFAEVGGFDERYVGYGGEDWDLAHRLWTAGAVFAHVPAAIGWHDGPDWAARGDEAARSSAKDAESLMLATTLPDPDLRGAGRWWPYCSVVVRVAPLSDVDALALVRSAFGSGADCAFWFDDIVGPHSARVLADPGVHLGRPPAEVTARAWCEATVNGRVDLSDLMALAESADRQGRIDLPGLVLRASRATRRADRRFPDGREECTDYLFGRRDRVLTGRSPAS